MADNACTTWDAQLVVGLPLRGQHGRPGLASNPRTLRSEHRCGVGFPICARCAADCVGFALRRRQGRVGVGVGLCDHTFDLRSRPCANSSSRTGASGSANSGFAAAVTMA